jgi:hypothetical protein
MKRLRESVEVTGLVLLLVPFIIVELIFAGLEAGCAKVFGKVVRIDPFGLEGAFDFDI